MYGTKKAYEKMTANERAIYHSNRAVVFARWSIAFAVIAVIAVIAAVIGFIR